MLFSTCSFIIVCSFIEFQKKYIPACLFWPARLFGSLEYLPLTAFVSQFLSAHSQGYANTERLFMVTYMQDNVLIGWHIIQITDNK